MAGMVGTVDTAETVGKADYIPHRIANAPTRDGLFGDTRVLAVRSQI
jgi:hypothetical protein